jgi:hypothetical protein
VTGAGPLIPGRRGGTGRAGPLARDAVLYECLIFHGRREPLRNAFSYRTCEWLVDVDDLPRPRGWPWLLAWFRARDHLGDPGRTIRANVDEFLRTRDVDLGGGQVLMLAHPGGLIPSVTAIEDSLERRTRLRVVQRHDFGIHYARTLRIWRDRFTARLDEVAALGFDEVFIRMWVFYLCYAEAGFRAGYLNVSQLTLERP